MKRRGLLYLAGYFLLMIGTPQVVHGEQLSVIFDQNQGNTTVTSALPATTNAYPGMRLPTETITVTNKGAQTILVRLTVNSGASLPEYLEGELAIIGQEKTTIYTLADGSKVLSLQMGSKETVTVEPRLTLSGELMDNETQDTSFDIRYRFTASEVVYQSSNQTDTTNTKNKKQTTFPKTNGLPSIATHLGCFLVGLVLLLIRKNNQRAKNGWT